jgi:hypothetical protein
MNLDFPHTFLVVDLAELTYPPAACIGLPELRLPFPLVFLQSLQKHVG